MLSDILKEELEEARDHFWDEHGFCDLTAEEHARLASLAKLKNSVDAIPGLMRYRAEDLFNVNTTRARGILEGMIRHVGVDYFPENAAAFVTAMTQKLLAPATERYHANDR
ncbi:hypothetical protein AB8B21_07290 [Tardiphaga sp. 866_E4_N2_1]|uniref:hypothetical protein n=1 Tax=unclassified Tardiphaga TaxID=2631404 RepID=UPI003F1E595B